MLDRLQLVLDALAQAVHDLRLLGPLLDLRVQLLHEVVQLVALFLGRDVHGLGERGRLLHSFGVFLEGIVARVNEFFLLDRGQVRRLALVSLDGVLVLALETLGVVIEALLSVHPLHLWLPGDLGRGLHVVHALAVVALLVQLQVAHFVQDLGGHAVLDDVFRDVARVVGVLVHFEFGLLHLHVAGALATLVFELLINELVDLC